MLSIVRLFGVTVEVDQSHQSIELILTATSPRNNRGAFIMRNEIMNAEDKRLRA